MASPFKQVVLQLNSNFKTALLTQHPEPDTFLDCLAKLGSILESVKNAKVENAFQEILLGQRVLGGLNENPHLRQKVTRFTDLLKAMVENTKALDMKTADHSNAGFVLFIFLHRLSLSYLYKKMAYQNNHELQDFYRLIEEAKHSLKFTLSEHLAKMKKAELDGETVVTASTTFMTDMLPDIVQVVTDQTSQLQEINADIEKLKKAKRKYKREGNAESFNKLHAETISKTKVCLQSIVMPERFMQILPEFFDDLRHYPELVGLVDVYVRRITVLYTQHGSLLRDLESIQCDQPIVSRVTSKDVTQDLRNILMYFQKSLSFIDNDLSAKEAKFSAIMQVTQPESTVSIETNNLARSITQTVSSVNPLPFFKRLLVSVAKACAKIFPKIADWAIIKVMQSKAGLAYFTNAIRERATSLVRTSSIASGAGIEMPVIRQDVEEKRQGMTNEAYRLNKAHRKVVASLQEKIVKLNAAIDKPIADPARLDIKDTLNELVIELDCHRGFGFDQNSMGALDQLNKKIQAGNKIEHMNFVDDEYDRVAEVSLAHQDKSDNPNIDEFRFELTRQYNQLFNAAITAGSGLLKLDVETNNTQKMLSALNIVAGQAPIIGGALSVIVGKANDILAEARIKRLSQACQFIGNNMGYGDFCNISNQVADKLIVEYGDHLKKLSRTDAKKAATYVFKQFIAELFNNGRQLLSVPDQAGDKARVQHWVDQLSSEIIEYVPSDRSQITYNWVHDKLLSPLDDKSENQDDKVSIEGAAVSLKSIFVYKHFDLEKVYKEIESLMFLNSNSVYEDLSYLSVVLVRSPQSPWVKHVNPAVVDQISIAMNANIQDRDQAITQIRTYLAEAASKLFMSYGDKGVEKLLAFKAQFENVIAVPVPRRKVKRVVISQIEEPTQMDTTVANQQYHLRQAILAVAKLDSPLGLRVAKIDTKLDDAQKQQIKDIQALLNKTSKSRTQAENAFLKLLQETLAKGTDNSVLSVDYLAQCLAKTDGNKENRRKKVDMRNHLAIALGLVRESLQPVDKVSLRKLMAMYNPSLPSAADDKKHLSDEQSKCLTDLKALLSKDNKGCTPSEKEFMSKLRKQLPELNGQYIEDCVKSSGFLNKQAHRAEKLKKRNALALAFQEVNAEIEAMPLRRQSVSLQQLSMFANKADGSTRTTSPSNSSLSDLDARSDSSNSPTP